MLTMTGETETLGERWISYFMKRIPLMAGFIGKPIDSPRIRGTQQHHIREFYELFDTSRPCHNIQEVDMWNMDQHGVFLDLSTNWVVLGVSGKRQTYIPSPENREWV